MVKSPLPKKSSLWDEITENKIVFLSVLGSVASIAALIITMMDKIALDRNLPPQLAAWRFILISICILCIGATVIVSYHWATVILGNTSVSLHWRIVRATIGIVAALIVIGIFLDGLYAALYWEIWLLPMIRELVRLVKDIFLDGP
jgi:NhaP-type Na+/H+ and K+/H+ antiporter